MLKAPAGEIPPGILVYAVRRTVSAIREGGLWLPGCLPLYPIVPEGIVALVLVEADTVGDFGAYLVGVDAGEEGGELAGGHTDGVLYAGYSRCFDHRTPHRSLLELSLTV